MFKMTKNELEKTVQDMKDVYPKKVTKLFKLEDSENPGIVRVEVLKAEEWISKVKVVEIVKKSEFRRCKVGQKLTVANRLLY